MAASLKCLRSKILKLSFPKGRIPSSGEQGLQLSGQCSGSTHSLRLVQDTRQFDRKSKLTLDPPDLHSSPKAKCSNTPKPKSLIYPTPNLKPYWAYFHPARYPRPLVSKLLTTLSPKFENLSALNPLLQITLNPKTVSPEPYIPK